MIRFETILDKVSRSRPDADLDLLRRAYLFSAKEHRGQVRKSGEPYLVHPLEVANILADMQLDVSCVTTGLLHDIVEDTNVSIDTIEQYFGGEIAHLVPTVLAPRKLSRRRHGVSTIRRRMCSPDLSWRCRASPRRCRHALRSRCIWAAGRRRSLRRCN